MGAVWSVGGARPAVVAPPPPSVPQVVRCPQCGAEDVRVRTSRGGISNLECQACHAAWRDARRLVRVLLAAP